MKATLNQYRQSPRKVRLVINSIRGKSVERALAELKFIPKRASGTIEKLIKSAVSNAETNSGKAKENLFIKEIRVDEGVTLKRMMPMSKGRAFRINKRTSHITLELGDKQESKKTNKQESKKTTKQDKKNKDVKDLPVKSEKKPTKVVKKEKVLKKK
ncbi:MAG: large subunit ribosomal protein L22 [Parcubacteria group bacterium Athens0714_16]|nr:MAG: large subunit ribosomal protein L22 [Parcubacteria group bacterium Athens0714_16]